MAQIELHNITRRFAGSTHPAIDDVSLSVERGEIYGIIGFSGAGKSTLLRTINLLERPDGGRVLVNGEDLTRLPKGEIRLRRRSMGMIFQHFNLIQNATVAENLSFPLEVAGVPKAERQARIARTLARVGIAEKADAYPARLSGGQKQRVGIARTLVSDPQILLCDEPTSALDPQTTDGILDFLVALNRDSGLTVVIVTHEMGVVKAICDKVSVMEHGRVVETLDLRGGRPAPQSGIGRYLFADAPRRVARHG